MRVNRERHRELIPYVVAIISVVEMFFLFLMVIHRNPFDTFLTQVPPDGRGLNPLLQNPYMVIHPPSLYIGFVGMTIPFAFGMAALHHRATSTTRGCARCGAGRWSAGCSSRSASRSG